MGKGKDLTDFDKGQIVMARRLGQSISKTASLVGCSRPSVISTYQKWNKEGAPVNHRQGHGRPRLIDACGEQQLADLVQTHKKATVAEIAGKVNAGSNRKVSECTVHRSLLRIGLRRVKRIKSSGNSDVPPSEPGKERQEREKDTSQKAGEETPDTAVNLDVKNVVEEQVTMIKESTKELTVARPELETCNDMQRPPKENVVSGGTEMTAMISTSARDEELITMGHNVLGAVLKTMNVNGYHTMDTDDD